MVLNLPLNLQNSTSGVLKFSTVETTPLFDYLMTRPISEVCLVLDEIYEREDEVDDSQRTGILTNFTAIA